MEVCVGLAYVPIDLQPTETVKETEKPIYSMVVLGEFWTDYPQSLTPATHINGISCSDGRAPRDARPGVQAIVRPTDSESEADSTNFIVTVLGCQGTYNLHL